jgi:hypothetical protein
VVSKTGTGPDVVIGWVGKLSIYGIICLLTIAVFTADRFHQVWLGSAVKRAIELDTRLGRQSSTLPLLELLEQFLPFAAGERTSAASLTRTQERLELRSELSLDVLCRLHLG